jgi:RNA recognition motif-containing protein
MNLYVSNLGNNVTDEDLKNIFTPHGEVSSAKIILDSFNGASRGFGFVEMPNDEEAQKAIDALHNSDYKETKLSVQVARPKEERKGSYPARTGGYRKY